MSPRAFLSRDSKECLAEFDEDDDERQVFHFDDRRERAMVLDTPLQRGILRAAVAAAAVLGLAALIAAA